MKKFLMIFLLLMLCLVSCKSKQKFNNADLGKIDYYVCGLYIEVDSSQPHTISDANPKLHFNFEDEAHFGFLRNVSGSGTSFANFSDLLRTVKEDGDVTIYNGMASIELPYSDAESFKLYLITYKNGTYTIDTSKHGNAKLGSSYTFISKFTKNSANYKIVLQIKF